MVKKRKAKKGFFYILKSEDMDCYKYGCSTNIKNRKIALNCQYKTKFDLMYSIYISDMFMFECYFKWELWRYCITGEIVPMQAVTLLEMFKYAKKIYQLNFAKKKIGI